MGGCLTTVQYEGTLTVGPGSSIRIMILMTYGTWPGVDKGFGIQGLGAFSGSGSTSCTGI